MIPIQLERIMVESACTRVFDALRHPPEYSNGAPTQFVGGGDTGVEEHPPRDAAPLLG